MIIRQLLFLFTIFQYKDSNEKKHFVYLYTLTLNNEAVLKAIDIIIDSLKINSL